MSAKFDDDISGPFDGGTGGFTPRYDERSAGGEIQADDYAADEYGGGEYGPGEYGSSDEDFAPESAASDSSGLELVGGVLFLAGCLPAAAVAKALSAGTNLAAEGLGGTAALAAGVAKLVGPWPALATAVAITVIGALMVLGTLRTEPLRRVGGAVVCGFGFAALMSALAPPAGVGLFGAGGQLGDGTGWGLASGMGTWAGVILGLAVMGGAVWLGFIQMPIPVDEDDGLGPLIERDESPPSAVGSALAGAAGAAVSIGAAAAAAGVALFKRQPRSESDVIGNRANRQRRVSNKKVRRQSAPATLGDAFARGGPEGVSHDEAAALAPDDKTLAYMEDVWRRASHTMEQPEPIPKSPYPDDVRLQGGIPDGATPIKPRPGQAAAPAVGPAVTSPGQAMPAYPAYAAIPPTVPPIMPPTAPAVPAADVAPFDFEDELSAPKPLSQTPPPPMPVAPATYSAAPAKGLEPGSADPFGGASVAGGLSAEEEEAYKAAVLREGASATGPSELPTGVTAFVPKPEEAAPAAASPVPPVIPSGAEPLAPLPDPIAQVPAALDSVGVDSEALSFPATAELLADDPMATQAMQAGAMPTSPSPPPRPAWEQGYDDEAPAAVDAGELDTIADVDESGRWSRREDADLGVVGTAQPSAAAEAPSMSVLDELLAQVEASESALDAAEAAAEAVEPEPEPEPEVEVEVDAALAEVDVVVPAVPEQAEEAELEAEVEELEEAEEVEAEAEEAEYEEDDSEEEEYEYVDEDGNPIDPADLDDEYEFVEEGSDEEAEESDDAEVEPEEEEEDAEEAEYEEEAEEEAAEYEEYDEEEEEDEDAEDEEVSAEVILEPQAPPVAESARPAPSPEVAVEDASAQVSEEAPEPLSADGAQLLEAGRMVVTKDRATVSVIQKGFDVEFAEACSILEALFTEGLIGPYQEGKKRAILMSLGEWEGRFAHS